jgi:beta-glucosidase
LAESEIDINGTLQVSVEVTNSGKMAGDEIVQLYVGYLRSNVDRPVKELKGFVKKRLDPGETKRIEFIVPAIRLAYYDEGRSDWVVEPTEYMVYVGSSALLNDLPGKRFHIRGK